ncbi:hypothetical protein EPZ47_25535 [Pseudomonas viciae]|uniref:Uncharacterized protein n=1 Tax=Pseudomonas viciae TaxID=2505979 RepID=A0A4P7PMZ3_9PSED|nr:hypothetical protein EPZ47_25535 [Pseudomonas viciae]
MLTKVPWVSGGQKGAHYIGFCCRNGCSQHLWRGSLLPLGCAATAFSRGASHLSGSKLPRHKSSLIGQDQWVRATANSLNSTNASRYSLAGSASRHLIARAT